ncbi:MAG: hypothetical protein OER92_08440 [Alphaproteobacteria bacterium]|nr:hypothetical protein [Alphaproteobacteria bacterium]
MRDDERVGRFVRENFSTALMSDTKWRKLITALDKADIRLEQAVVKFVDTNDIHSVRMPKISALHPPKPFIDTIEFGPLELRAIEWFEIPAVAVWPRSNNLPPRRSEQDIDAARAIVEGLGKYPVEQTSTGLRIIGYIR